MRPMKTQTATAPAYWWVNHGPAAARELGGGYLWSPKKTRAPQPMTLALPGDIVFSHAHGELGAVGVVLERVRTAPAPAPGRATAAREGEAGWLLLVRFEPLPQPLDPRKHMARLKPVLPARRAPLRAGGGASPIYLSAVPEGLATVLCELLGEQLTSLLAEISVETDGQLAQAGLEERIWQRTDLAPAEKRQLVSARAGQGRFRAAVERLETACRVTGVLDRRHLRATHIKPWHACDDPERLDGANGLLLAPHIEHLFSRGHISFADNGELLISEHLNRFVKKAWGLERARSAQPFRPEQRAYLRFHRHEVFEKAGRGRRR